MGCCSPFRARTVAEGPFEGNDFPVRIDRSCCAAVKGLARIERRRRQFKLRLWSLIGIDHEQFPAVGSHGIVVIDHRQDDRIRSRSGILMLNGRAAGQGAIAEIPLI